MATNILATLTVFGVKRAQDLAKGVTEWTVIEIFRFNTA
jgi:hypothetical protein